MAIVSKAIFEKDARADGRILVEGETWATDRYVSQNKGLAPLAEGGDLFLVTVRPPDEALWLVGVLRGPKSGDGMWKATPNVLPIRAISDVKGRLRFANGAGLQAKPGALGMSLQTPRILAEADVALLLGTATAPLATPPTKQAKAAPETKTAKPTKVATPKAAPADAPSANALPTKPVNAEVTADGLPELDQALAALRSDDVFDALEHVLAAWRKTPDTTIAALLDAVSAEVDRSLTPIDVPRAELQTTWLDLAARRRSTDVGRLLAVLPNGGVALLRERYKLLGVFAPDPRVVETALRIPTRYHSYEAGPLLAAAFDFALKTRDPRSKAVLDEMLASFLVPLPAASKAWREHLEKHGRKATKVLAALPAPATLPKPIAAQVTTCRTETARLARRTDVPRLVEAPPSKRATEASAMDAGEGGARKGRRADHEALFAAVYADPDSDEPREVLSDALQQADDPRGEFIALQLERARKGKVPGAAEKRERELWKEHGRAWTAPLDVALKPETVRFERGFLAAGRVEWATDKQRDALMPHPMWSTLRELDTEDIAFATQPMLARLRRASFPAHVLAKLAARPTPLPLEAVLGPPVMSYGIRTRFGIWPSTAEGWGAALDVGALTSLRTLQLRSWGSGYDEDPSDENNRSRYLEAALTPNALAWLLDSKLGAQLEELDLFDTQPLAPWIEALAKRRGNLRVRIRFTNDNTASGSTAILATFELVRNGELVDVAMTFNNEMANLQYLTMPGQIERAMKGLPHAKAPAARVTYVGSKKRTKLGFPAIAEVLARAFPKLTLA